MTRWALFRHLFKQYPWPMLIIVAECLHLVALIALNYANRSLHSALPATRFAEALLLYIGVAVVLATLAQLASPAFRQRNGEIIRSHPLVAGWVCVIAFRLLLAAALHLTSARVQLIGGYVIAAVTLAWILGWAWLLGRQSRAPAPATPASRRNH